MIGLNITGRRYYTHYIDLPYIYEGAEYKIKSDKPIEHLISNESFLVDGVRDKICSIKGDILNKETGYIPVITITWNRLDHSKHGNEERVYLTHDSIVLEDAIKLLSDIFIKCKATLDKASLSTELCKCTAVIQHNLDNISRVNRLVNMIDELIQHGDADFTQLRWL